MPLNVSDFALMPTIKIHMPQENKGKKGRFENPGDSLQEKREKLFVYIYMLILLQ